MAAPAIDRVTANQKVVFDTALPERMTDSKSGSRSYLVYRARPASGGVDSKNESRSPANSSQCHRYVDQRTSTGPATGIFGVAPDGVLHGGR